MGALRAILILAGFFLLTLPLMPVQALLLRFAPRAARTFPHWYHRQVCRLMGIRLNVTGEVAKDRPALLIANHSSWVDITVLSAIAPLSFVAKKEVGGWPFVSSLAKLQRTIFVDREKRASVGETTGEIISRLAAGDNIVLFAEGTSSDGNRVLPFKTSLFAAAKPSKASPSSTDADKIAVAQTVSIVYTRLCGIPMGRADRPVVSWYGDMEMGGHAWQLLKAGALDVSIHIGPPVPLSSFADRKVLARTTEDEVRLNVVRTLRARSPDEPIVLAAISEEERRSAGKRPESLADGKFR